MIRRPPRSTLFPSTPLSRSGGPEIAAGRSRLDLLYRLNVVPIDVPPLRARRADVAQLVAHFVTQMTRSGGLPAKPFDAEAVQQLAARDWPGNIRELKNAIERFGW